MDGAKSEAVPDLFTASLLRILFYGFTGSGCSGLKWWHMTRKALIVLLLGGLTLLAEDYKGPRPPKPDMLYLLHASTLVPTDVAEAQQETKKDELTYSVSGASSQARTPLAEPIFIMQSDKITAESLELYRFEVKNGRRELTMSQKRRGSGAKPLRLQVTKLDRGLYRIEAAEGLANGEYGLSPGGANGTNRVFCFQVY